jgi:hypothetical protein
MVQPPLLFPTFAESVQSYLGGSNIFIFSTIQAKSMFPLFLSFRIVMELQPEKTPDF